MPGSKTDNEEARLPSLMQRTGLARRLSRIVASDSLHFRNGLHFSASETPGIKLVRA